MAVASATAAEDRLNARARDFVARRDSVDMATRVLAVDADTADGSASDASAMETLDGAALSAPAAVGSTGDVLTVFEVVEVTTGASTAHMHAGSASADAAHAPLTAHVIRAYRHRSNTLQDSSYHSAATPDANACVLIASAVPSLATAADIERAFASQACVVQMESNSSRYFLVFCF